jgi:hypothetical protein
MKHFKNPITNEVFGYESDGSQDHLIDHDFIPLSATEEDTIRNAAMNYNLTRPDVNGFIQNLKTSLGGIVTANNFATAYPLFLVAVQNHEWGDVQELVVDAKLNSVITIEQYNLIKTAAATFNIPVVL